MVAEGCSHLYRHLETLAKRSADHAKATRWVHVSAVRRGGPSFLDFRDNLYEPKKTTSDVPVREPDPTVVQDPDQVAQMKFDAISASLGICFTPQQKEVFDQLRRAQPYNLNRWLKAIWGRPDLIIQLNAHQLIAFIDFCLTALELAKGTAFNLWSL